MVNNEVYMAICIASSRACIMKPSIRIAGRLGNVLNENHRITYHTIPYCPRCDICYSDNAYLSCVFGWRAGVPTETLDIRDPGENVFERLSSRGAAQFCSFVIALLPTVRVLDTTG